MLDKTSSIICAFGLASAAPRSPYRHLELCGIALDFCGRLASRCVPWFVLRPIPFGQIYI
ncbi:hypothetical protein [Gemmiger qucibialis]|uniref:hypothetical protein n=1 Tax=Gemmiger qucibialis TaxID=2997294 RepID=UPI0022E290A3|nr:hypothetical protein [Gemmiger qucibialis]